MVVAPQVLRALRESKGIAIAVADEDMIQAANLIGSTQGLFVAPEGGATLVAYQKLRESGWLDESEKVVLFNTGSGYKYYSLWK